MNWCSSWFRSRSIAERKRRPPARRRTAASKVPRSQRGGGVMPRRCETWGPESSLFRFGLRALGTIEHHGEEGEVGRRYAADPAGLAQRCGALDREFLTGLRPQAADRPEVEVRRDRAALGGLE